MTESRRTFRQLTLAAAAPFPAQSQTRTEEFEVKSVLDHEVVVIE